MKKKRILILEHVESYVENDKELLKKNGFKTFALKKNDHLSKGEWTEKIKNFVSKNQIDLIFADTGFHFNIVEILKEVKVKVLYLSYLGKKYKERQGKSLPKPWLTREDLMSGSKKLIEEIKKLL